MSRGAGTVVACYTLDGELVKVYDSAKKAATNRHLFPRTIDRCIRGDLNSVKGLQWKRFKIGEVPHRIPPLEINPNSLTIKPVAKLDENGEIEEVYSSIKSAAKKNGIDTHSLRDRLNKKYEYLGKTKFRFLTDDEIEKFGFQKGKIFNNQIKAVIQYSLDGQYVKTYPSIRAALIALGKSPKNRGIHQCLSGEFDTAFGYVWKYRDFPNAERPRKKKVYICCFNSDGELIKKYISTKEVASELKVSISAINNAIRLSTKIKGYYWKRQ